LTAEIFDDGRTDFPAGAAEPVERVVVVGAGIAGLTVANALTHGGVECVVVEARNRIGGRLQTVDLTGFPVDLGAPWIHTPVGNPVRAFAQHAGVPCRSANPLPELAGFDCGEQRRLVAAEVEANLGMQLEGFPQATGRLLAELGPNASAADGIEAFVAETGLAPGPARRARQALYALVPFWRAAGLPHAMIFPRDPGAPAVWAIGQDAFGAGPVLVFQTFHSAASRILGTAPDDAAQWVLGMLAEAIGSSCPPPAAVAVTSWANDPYSGGAYTHIPPGANPADADVLGEPIAGRLLFAGEHAQSARLAYADGAMTSGIREAKRLLGQPGVRLSPIPAAHG
jgi:monoamine oxidase